ncbi:MAG: plasma-membrane proton-efflux P-type ATPase, partial [Rhodomicrobium sp.]|nr:plasma-membrane proton-efflux P-type ATPase [Rhodomicrobium sp.]
LVIGWHEFGLGGDPGRLRTFTFEALLFFSLFSMLSIRERRAWWASRPSTILCVALFADAVAGVAIGIAGLGELLPLAPAQIAFVAIYTLIFSLIFNDLVKAAFIARFWNNEAAENPQHV